MNPRIEHVASKKLIGKPIAMTFADNKTQELWKGFMPRRNEIRNTVGTELVSMQVYGSAFDFSRFNPHAPFEKWAAVEVTEFSEIPTGMETVTLPGGLYAIFAYQGSAADAAPFFRYIFGTWLPQSGYVLDRRPHFEILGAKYKNNHPDSEEDIYIPVREWKIES